MTQEATARAHDVLTGLFSHLGQRAQGSGQAPPAGLNLEWMAEQATQFIEMPAQLAETFATMAVDLTDLVLKALAEAGLELITGLTPM